MCEATAHGRQVQSVEAKNSSLSSALSRSLSTGNGVLCESIISSIRLGIGLVSADLSIYPLYASLHSPVGTHSQPPPSPDNDWDSEEEDGIADQHPLDVSW